MKYALKIFFVMLVTAGLLIGSVWLFSNAERQYALNQYVKVNENSVNTIQYEVQNNIDKWKDSENNINYEGLLGELPKYDFQSVSILNKNGTVMASTDENIKSAFINSLGTEGIDAFFNVNGACLNHNGKSYYFAKVISDDYRIMCMISENNLVSEKTQISLINCVEILLILMIVAVCMTMIIMLYKRKFSALYKVKPVGNYTISTTKTGTILEADKNFVDTFGKVKLDECFLSQKKSLKEALTSGNLLLFMLKNKQGETRKIAFNATRGLNEYKLVGSDVTQFMTRYDDLMNKFETDGQTGLANIQQFKRDWVAFVQTNNYQDGLMCFFGIQNLDYYRMIYGEENFSNGLKQLASKICELLEEYGKIYSVMGRVFLMIKSKEQKEKFVRNIGKIQEKLSEAMSFCGDLVKFDIRLGVIYLTALKQNTKIDNVLNAGAKVVKYAREIEDIPYYIQRVTTFEGENQTIVTKTLINELVERGSLDIYFQPQLDVKTEKVVGFDSLFTFTDNRIKDINIADFVALAEKQGQIAELNEFMYKKAMDFAYLIQQYNLTISVKISLTQLIQTGFVEKFLEEYKVRTIKPGIMRVKIDENAIIYSMSDVIQKIELLKSNGIATEIDNFGVANSSMLHLKQLPITAIKINKAFIENIEKNEKDRNLVKNIINIIKDLGLICIAKDIERKGQKEILEKFGCDVMQGYYAQAMPKEKSFQYFKKINKDMGEKS